MLYAVCFVLGFILSWIFTLIRFKNGAFQINETDANKDVYKMVIDDFNKLHRRRYLLVRINYKLIDVLIRIGFVDVKVSVSISKIHKYP